MASVAARGGGGEGEWVSVTRTREGTLGALRLEPSARSGDEPRAACLVLADLAAADPAAAFEEARVLGALVAALGCAAYVTQLGDLPGAAEVAVAQDVPDRVALARLDGLLDHAAQDPRVDADRIGVVGLGRGGTLAFLFGCHSAGVGAVASLGGHLVYPALGPARPLQPLEMALNLGCPCLLVFAAQDPALPAAERERARQVLSQFARSFDIVTMPGDVVRPGSDVSEALARFLTETLELG